MSFIARQGAGGFIHGNVLKKTSMRGRLAFMRGSKFVPSKTCSSELTVGSEGPGLKVGFLAASYGKIAPDENVHGDPIYEFTVDATGKVILSYGLAGNDFPTDGTQAALIEVDGIEVTLYWDAGETAYIGQSVEIYTDLSDKVDTIVCINLLDTTDIKFLAGSYDRISYELELEVAGVGGATAVHAGVWSPDKDGVMHSFKANEPVWEGSRFIQNHVLWSENTSDATWATADVTSEIGLPDGPIVKGVQLPATRLTPGSAGRRVMGTIDVPIIDGVNYTISVWVKNDTPGANTAGYYFRHSVNSPTFSLTDEWVRQEHTFVGVSGWEPKVTRFFDFAANTIPVLVAGFSWERADSAGSYIKTEATVESKHFADDGAGTLLDPQPWLNVTDAFDDEEGLTPAADIVYNWAAANHDDAGDSYEGDFKLKGGDQALLSMGGTAVLRVQGPFGPELMTDYEFDNPGAWLTNGDWVVAGGVATVGSASTKGQAVYQSNIPFDPAKTYRWEVKCNSLAQGAWRVRIATSSYSSVFSDAGIKSGELTGLSTGTCSVYAEVVPVDGIFEYFSIREVVGISDTVVLSDGVNECSVPAPLPTEQKLLDATFDTDIDGFTNPLPERGSVTWDAGTIKTDSTGGTGFAGAVKQITCVAGQVYTISVEITVATAESTLKVVDTPDGIGIGVLGEGGLLVGVHTFDFTADATNHYINLQGPSAADEIVNWDNVSVKLKNAPVVAVPHIKASYGGVLVSDTFADVDGTDLSTHTPDNVVAGGWQASAGYVINAADQLKYTLVGAGVALIDASVADCIVTATIFDTGSSGSIVVRTVDTANLWVAFHSGTNLTLQEKTSNTWTVRAELPYALSGQHTIKVICKGDNIRVEEGANSVTYDSPVRNAVTTHGYFSNIEGDPISDDFKIIAGEMILDVDGVIDTSPYDGSLGKAGVISTECTLRELARRKA